MATPKIKVYKVNSGYSESADTDIQPATNDELLPIVDKPILPADAYYLTGVTGVGFDADGVLTAEAMVDVGDTITETLAGSGLKVQNATVGNWIGTGGYVPVLVSEGVTLHATTTNSAGVTSVNYVIDYVAGTVTFEAAAFPSGYPVDVEATFTVYSNTAALKKCVAHAPVYNGANDSFRAEFYAGSTLLGVDEYVFDAAKGEITLVNPATPVYAKYYYLSNPAHLFVSEHQNWISGHLRANPDVFVGMKEYPGTSSEDTNGNPVVLGAIPAYVDSGYSIDQRAGSVYFSEAVTTHPAYAGPPVTLERYVRANYGYYKGVMNVTDMKFDLISSVAGYKYKAVTEKRFPAAHDKRLVTRTDYLMPRFFKVGAEQFPSLVTVSPYDAATRETSMALAAGASYDFGSGVKRLVFSFTGTNGQTAFVVVCGISVKVGNRAGSFVWEWGMADEHVFTTPGESILRQYAGFEIVVTWLGAGSLVFSVGNKFAEVTYGGEESPSSSMGSSN